MRRIFTLCFALLLGLCPLAGAAADPLPLGEDLVMDAFWPEGADRDSALLCYTSRYPTVDGDDPIAEVVNAYYAYAVDDALLFDVPMHGGMAELQGSRDVIDIRYEVTCNSDRYFSVLLLKTMFIDGDEKTSCTAQVFGRESGKAGNIISLPYLLGLLADDETDEWLLNRQINKAETFVRDLIWELAVSGGLDGLYEEPDRELYDDFFFPEEDFYLDANEDPVFFVQPGILAPESMGVLTFPITLEELLDEL